MDEALKVAPAEYWRYVLIATRPEARDANFTWRDFEAHVNSELNDVLGNFVHRTLTFVNSNFNSKIPEPQELDEKDEALKNRIESSPSKVSQLFDQFQLRSALAEIIELARAGNQYLSEREPWHLVKKDRAKTATTLYFAVAGRQIDRHPNFPIPAGNGATYSRTTQPDRRARMVGRGKTCPEAWSHHRQSDPTLPQGLRAGAVMTVVEDAITQTRFARPHSRLVRRPH